MGGGAKEIRMLEQIQQFTTEYCRRMDNGDVIRGMKKGGGGNWFPYSGGHVQISFGGTNAPMKVTDSGLAEAARTIESQEEFDAISREMRDRHNIYLRPYGCGRYLQSGFELNPPEDCIEPLRLVYGTSDYFPGRNCVLAVPITEKASSFVCGSTPGYVNALWWGEGIERRGYHPGRYVYCISLKGDTTPFIDDEGRAVLRDEGIEFQDKGDGFNYRIPRA